MPHVVKDCFGTVISTLKKMRECARCELLAECRQINWPVSDIEEPLVVVRRPSPQAEPRGEAQTPRGADVAERSR